VEFEQRCQEMSPWPGARTARFAGRNLRRLDRPLAGYLALELAQAIGEWPTPL
jgi:hypothetical protein